MSGTINWSYSTVNTLRQCNRKFYFASLLATHGRKNPLRRKAYELKSMQNLKMWAGSVVDKFMEIVIIPAITNKEDLFFDRLADRAVKMAEEQFKYSKFGFYKDPSQKKGDANSTFCILDIHEIKAPYTEEELASCYATIHQAILRLPEIRLPDGSLLIDYLKAANSLTPNVNNWLVQIAKARLKPQIDLLGMYNWKPIIIDWKLSASHVSDYSRQLVICGIAVYLKRLENPEKKPWTHEDIKLYEVNLLKGIVKQHEFTEDKVNDLINFINLTSSDIQLLIGSEGSEAVIEDFELTDDEGHCKNCNFQGLCSYLLINNNQYDEKSYIESIQGKQLI
ncbi:PD-(D/E)XK nuclease superfamily protein [Chitinophaga costaii]|uniref:PD-(D/E)XK nuclease superfamily protein n=1 Tax=Chitinophaga costaii TaxID=1335309 RepID=A0A1C3ZY40_9BACT|nr:PD-(D/E)XK nuclease family protein [Chitinophaga costaii]PUZ30548.1 hypothetical protein DCM91_03530 [Chitinophaga costaii]SCB87140.1 PD-(D/E)XK nuclease superfamily protein [Chitinophaga costaii]